MTELTEIILFFRMLSCNLFRYLRVKSLRHIERPHHSRSLGRPTDRPTDRPRHFAPHGVGFVAGARDARGFVDFVGVAPRVPVSLARVVGDGSRGEPTLRSS